MVGHCIICDAWVHLLIDVRAHIHFNDITLRAHSRAHGASSALLS
jgi:predicted DCC family thiol-disulfide oxidoreductase YuxK